MEKVKKKTNTYHHKLTQLKYLRELIAHTIKKNKENEALPVPRTKQTVLIKVLETTEQVLITYKSLEAFTSHLTSLQMKRTTTLFLVFFVFVFGISPKLYPQNLAKKSKQRSILC